MALAERLTLGRWIFVGGKGGVGKTTTAAALAVEIAQRGERVRIVSVDPAHSLGDALEVQLGGEPREVAGLEALTAMEVDPERERTRFLSERERWIVSLIESGTYLDREDVEGFVQLALPGMDELAALLVLMRCADEPENLLIVDTAPTGHTLRLLELPRILRGWLGALEAMDEKERAVAMAMAGAFHSEAAEHLLEPFREDLSRLEQLLSDPEHTRFVLVTTTEPVVLAETRRYQEELTRLRIALGGIVVNRSRPRPGGSVPAGKGMVFVPPLEREPTGVHGLRSFAAAAAGEPYMPEKEETGGGGAGLHVGGAFRPPSDRRIYLVGGKGGVGKSTSAAALALYLLEEGRNPVLLLSTDPAGSLGDVLDAEIGSQATTLAGAPGLLAQQIDADRAWNRWREEYRETTERVFAELLGGNLSADADRLVVQRLLDLAPPGIDELVALMEVVDLSEYDALVLDTAPTGHLLRLLEMPEIALQWTHQLLRLLLKYREVIGLGGLGERVLSLSRKLRSLKATLSDPAHTWMLVVALPEALSVPETRRLLRKLEAAGIPGGALLVNRALRDDGAEDAVTGRALEQLARIDPDLPLAAAPALDQGPHGPGGLRSFLSAWRELSRTASNP